MGEREDLLAAYTRCIRRSLVDPAVDEGDIRRGDRILLVEPDADRTLTAYAATVGGVYAGSAPDSPLLFAGKLGRRSGMRTFRLDDALRVIADPVLEESGLAIISRAHACGGFAASYDDRTFRLAYVGAGSTQLRHVLETLTGRMPATLRCANDPALPLLLSPERMMRASALLLGGMISGQTWSVENYVPGGPEGSFSRLGYRMLTERAYNVLVGRET